ncbi:hypothetical protein [Leisingera caerulea]|uniref:hypothetical protein n=1 Tax=Leisingera caerulea TaxID=506591 RepID=UPI000406E3B5|nr:hypothetical protein [Leisingera caerulea]
MAPLNQEFKPTLLATGQPLPLEMGLAIASQPAGMSGGLFFDLNMILMRLDQPRKRELRDFNKQATVRLGDFGSFLLFSPKFRGFSFDLLWSPVIARAQDGAGMVAVNEGERLNLNFVLVDERTIVRGIRVGTIGPKASGFLARTQRNLMGRDVDAEQVQRDMERLFGEHPHGIPDKMFKARSAIGA